jgi:hypothetical protein
MAVVGGVTRLGRFLWDFLVGDDPLATGAVVAAVALTALVQSLGVAAWWLLAVAVPLILFVSLRRASSPAHREDAESEAEYEQPQPGL